MLKAVIFDMGGVLVRTHSRAGREQWAERLGLDSWELENLVFNGDSGRQVQLGQKSAESHWRELGKQFGLTEAELAELRHDFFAGDALDESLLAYVDRLREAGYRTGLLSNAGDDVRRVLTVRFPVIDYFDGVVISAEVGLMKPDPQIYRLAADSVGVKLAESLFVDDFIENVEGARQVGMQAIHYTHPAKTQRELVELTGVV